MACFQEMTAAELTAWQQGYQRGNQLPQINAGAADDDQGFFELYGIDPEMSAEERLACVNGFEAARAPEIDAGDDDDDDQQTDQIRSRLERIARAVFGSELAGRPIYLEWASNLPETFVAINGALAITSPSLDLGIKPYIEGRWEGRSRAIILNDHLHLECFPDDQLDAALCQTLAHELAHCAEEGFPEEISPDQQAIRARFMEMQLKMSREAYGDLFAGVAVDLGAEPINLKDPFSQHGPAFWRAFVHCCHRAINAGAEFSPEAECEKYGLSPFAEYEAALRDELVAFADAPLVASLRSTDPPADFLDLFAADVARIRSTY